MYNCTKRTSGLFIIFLLSLISGCNQNKTTSPQNSTEFQVHILDDLNGNGQLKISSLSDRISFLRLETNAQCLISNIKNVLQKGDDLIILSDDQQIFKYNKNGRFINQIGKKGKGPKEYYSIIDYAADDSCVYIVDYGKRIVKYSFDGKFIDYLKISKKEANEQSFCVNKFLFSSSIFLQGSFQRYIVLS